MSPFERPFLVPRRASEQKMSLPVERDESEPDIWPLSAGHLPQGQQQPRAQILSWGALELQGLALYLSLQQRPPVGPVFH